MTLLIILLLRKIDLEMLPHLKSQVTLALSLLTWLLRNLKVTISIQSCPSDILDPMLDLSGPGIDTMAGTFSTIANHANLGKSVKVKIFKMETNLSIMF